MISNQGKQAFFSLDTCHQLNLLSECKYQLISLKDEQSIKEFSTTDTCSGVCGVRQKWEHYGRSENTTAANLRKKERMKQSDSKGNINVVIMTGIILSKKDS